MPKAENVSPPNTRFTPQDRLRSKQDFQQVFQGDRVGSRQFVLYYRQVSHAKIGIIISKKNIKNAVDRNRVKRVIRDWFRHNDINDLEMVFIANKASNSLTNKEIRQCLEQLLQRVIARLAKP
ncbi:MAG: ribonuclease P protein component [Coxiellaceae bacterium]|nr:ribonuclease P protein component [Coxiellaceae bacterium]